jgi:hypothetical protein
VKNLTYQQSDSQEQQKKPTIQVFLFLLNVSKGKSEYFGDSESVKHCYQFQKIDYEIQWLYSYGEGVSGGSQGFTPFPFGGSNKLVDFTWPPIFFAFNKLVDSEEMKKFLLENGGSMDYVDENGFCQKHFKNGGFQSSIETCL